MFFGGHNYEYPPPKELTSARYKAGLATLAFRIRTYPWVKGITPLHDLALAADRAGQEAVVVPNQVSEFNFQLSHPP